MGGWTFMCALQSNFSPYCWDNVSSFSLHRGWKASEWLIGWLPMDPTFVSRTGGECRTDLWKPLAGCLRVGVSVFRLCQTPWPRPRVLRQTYPFQLKARQWRSKITNFASWTPSSCRHFIFAPDILQDMPSLRLMALLTHDTSGSRWIKATL